MTTVTTRRVAMSYITGTHNFKVGADLNQIEPGPQATTTIRT